MWPQIPGYFCIFRKTYSFPHFCRIWIEDYETWKISKKIPHHRTLGCQGMTERQGEQHENNTAGNSFPSRNEKTNALNINWLETLYALQFHHRSKITLKYWKNRASSDTWQEEISAGTKGTVTISSQEI